MKALCKYEIGFHLLYFCTKTSFLIKKGSHEYTIFISFEYALMPYH